MGITRKAKKVKLFASIIYREEAYLSCAEKRLVRIYGPVEALSYSADFDYTDYYYPEMGRPLRRKVICFKKLISPDNVYRIKQRTNRIEGAAVSGKNRRVNIDPGYLHDGKVVLLTTKDYTHRVYLGGGMFGESTLYFQDGAYRAWPWTYPDYASKEMTAFFKELRGLYLADLEAARHFGASKQK